MKFLESIPFLKSLLDELRQVERIDRLEKERDEYKNKYDNLMDGFNKYLKGQLVKSRGKK